MDKSKEHNARMRTSVQQFVTKANRFAPRQIAKFQRYWRPKLHNLAHLAKTISQGHVVNAYWSNVDVNFGDAITPVLLSHYGLTPICTPPSNAKFASTGSILHHLPSDFAGYILGSGFISEQYAQQYKNAKILGLRGVLSRELMQAPKDIVLGDPGLLLPRILANDPHKKYLVGIVPHFVDKRDARVQKLCIRYSGQVKLIDVQRSPRTVLKEIAQCEYILSSSLHGIVVADGLGIPNAWLVLSNKVKGGEFKFRDYFSAIDGNCDPTLIHGNEDLKDLVALTHTPSPQIAAVQTSLEAAFQNLSRLFP